jgi:fructose-bisphosphate aldolase, class I
MGPETLEEIARALVEPGRGILAADESTPTITKRFQSIGVESSEQTRLEYREGIFSTPGLGEFISGVILFDETLRQKTSRGIPIPELLREQNILPGIKVDRGARPLALFPGEKVTEGLDGLRERFGAYYELGARFSKWRAVISIGPDRPTRTCLKVNAHALARYAALSQEAGLVPIVEPEVLMEGDHSLERCEEVTTSALQLVFGALAEQRVRLEGILLKPSMVISGSKAAPPAAVGEVAEATLRCLRRAVPAAVPGVVFLSGGQSDVLATRHLNAMNQLGAAPWELSFSYGRALQDAAMKAWSGRSENLGRAQEALHHRARCNSLARFGKYSDDLR